MPAAVQEHTAEATNANSPLPSPWLAAQPWCSWWVSQWQQALGPIVCVLDFVLGFINEMVYGTRWEAIWVQSGLASGVLYFGKKLSRSVQVGRNLWFLPYADGDKDLVSVCMELCAQEVKFVVCFWEHPSLGWAHDGDGPTLSALPVERHHECHTGWQGRGADFTQVWIIATFTVTSSANSY